MGEIPERHRAALRAALGELAADDRPGLLMWVSAYGRSGAEPPLNLVCEIWSHPWTNSAVRENGSASGSVPLWTTDESPSDLGTEFEATPSGAVLVTDVHVL